MADGTTGQKLFVFPEFGGPGKCIMLVDAERRLVDRLTPADAVGRLGIAMKPWVKSPSPRQPLTPADLAKATTSWGLQTSAMAPVRQLLDWPIGSSVAASSPDDAAETVARAAAALANQPASVAAAASPCPHVTRTVFTHEYVCQLRDYSPILSALRHTLSMR